MPDDFEALKARHRAIREQLPDSLDLRVHRALSWLHRSEQCADDDGRFVFLWIAFNAVYAQEMGPRRRCRSNGSCAISSRSSSSWIATGSSPPWSGPSSPTPFAFCSITSMCFQPYWECQNGVRPRGEWHGLFERAKVTASRALGSKRYGPGSWGGFFKTLYSAQPDHAWRLHLEQFHQPGTGA